jgi:hypothetical protein
MLINPKKLALPVLLIIGLIMGCGLMDQTDEANKIVTEANKMIMEDNQQTIATNLQLQQLVTAMTSAANFESYKKENKAKFDDLMAKFNEMEKNETTIVEKFRQASQLKLNEKYKQYLELKVQEFSKQVEATKLVNPLIKSLLETSDTEKINAQLDAYDAKNETIRKEAEAIQTQADQIAKDNPTLIR